jgi:1,4-dihydroxy-2-naphthoyl-CoA hydrolase
MAIWFDGISLDLVNEHNRRCLPGQLGIEFTSATDDSVTARMPVDERTRQPAGMLHGGASVVLAETLATWGATFAADRRAKHCVGLEINANHVRPVESGYVVGTARPAHIGRTTQIWEVRIVDEKDKLVCVSRVTMAVLDRASSY